MKQPFLDRISKNQYLAIVNLVKELSTKRFQHLNLANELTNFLLMQIFKNIQAGISEEIIENLFPKAVEMLFQQYYNSCFNYCNFKTRDHNLSEDTAQEAIKQLLMSNNTINNVDAWLQQVTSNLLCKHYRAKNKDKELYQELRIEASVLQEIMTAEGMQTIDEMLPAHIQKLLASREYQDYQNFLSFANLKDYSAAMNINEKAAQKRKDKMIRNLRAKILLTLGWEAMPDILSFGQYNAILKFIRNLPLAANSNKDGRQSTKYSADLAGFLKGIERIDDWGITMVDKRRFRLYLFHLDAANQPILVTFFIVLNHRNIITIDGYLENDLVGIHPMPSNMFIPKDQGRSIWDYDTIISFLDG